MKELLTLQGGYPREMDYLLNLQAELYTMSNGLFSGLGVDMVLSGCAVHDNGNGTVNIAAGLVYISGEVLRYDGENNIIADGSKAFAKGAYTATDSKLFADGFNKNVYREAKAITADAAGTIAEVKIKTSLYTLKQYIQDCVNASEPVGSIKHIYDLDGTFLTNFDGSGLGVTPRWLKWALDNGNNGTPGSPGMSLVAAGTYTDPVSGEETVYSSGVKGGARTHKITAAEAPTPAGTVNELDGPHRKPADGGGDLLFYVKSMKGTAAAASAISLEGPFIGAYRLVKIAE